MNSSREKPRRPHVLIVAYEAPGHYYPFLHLLYECALYDGVTVTFACNEGRITELRSLHSKGEFNTLDLRLETVWTPGVLLDPANPTFPASAWSASVKRGPEMEVFVSRLIKQMDSPEAPTCMVADNLTAFFTQSAASRLGIPWYPLVVAVPGYLITQFESPMLWKLRGQQSSPGGHEPLDVPGLEYTRLRDLPVEIFTCPFEYISSHADIFSKASAILFNTTAELHAPSGTLEGINTIMKRRASAENRQAPKSFCVGPMLNFPGFRALGQTIVQTSTGSSAPLRFLNTQAPASVLYISFGSLASITSEIVTELAHGLEASGVPFIWVLRNTDLSLQGPSPASLLPSGFEDRIRGRGFIEYKWAPQAEILSHPSTGGYLCHCGWNSIMESFCAALPLITWPLGAEQHLSARFVEKVAKTGIAVRHFAPDKEVHETTWDVKPTRSDVQRAITFLMIEEGVKELRKNAQEMKKLVTDAVGENGSSKRSLRMFLDEILRPSTRRTK